MELVDNYRSVQISIITPRWKRKTEEKGGGGKTRSVGRRAWKGTTQLREIELGTSAGGDVIN